MVPGLRRETWHERVRRRRRSLTRYTGLRFWMLSRGMLMLATVGALYVAGGLVIGWRTAYEIAVGITSPGAVASPPAALPTSPTPSPSAAVVALAWAVSLTGWLVAPGIAGAVAGYSGQERDAGAFLSLHLDTATRIARWTAVCGDGPRRPTARPALGQLPAADVVRGGHGCVTTG